MIYFKLTTIKTLIIGGGISGITAAVELAEAGREVVLIEKEPYLGGQVSGFNSYFPKLCPPACGLEINFRRIRSNPRITYFTGAEVADISGSDGDFSVKIAIRARLINKHCTACGKCADVCPEEMAEANGWGAGTRAAYIPGGLAFPMKYTIDPESCKKEACGKCLDVCAHDAIQLDARATEIELQVGKIIVATGWKLYDPSRIENYSYVQEKDVITNLEFEHLMASCTRENKKLTRPSDGKKPGRIAFIQCAGSRDHNHLPYCSAVCCSASLKHALTLAENYPEISSEIFYIDLRVSGRNEKLLKRAESNDQITLTRGKAGRITQSGSGEGLQVEVEDVMAGRRREETFDLVILAMGLEPNHIATDLEQSPGIFIASSCKRPMDVVSSVRDATATALKTMQH
ncbi:MAG: FAD-dependent oxidoreductase [Bacteroidota bacterium]